MKVEVINPYASPYEVWSKREATDEETIEHFKKHGYFSSKINDELLETIGSPVQAAEFMVRNCVHNGLNSWLEGRIEEQGHATWLKHMPEQTPEELRKYQEEYPAYDAGAVDQILSKLRFVLPVGQVLFHGGAWPWPVSVGGKYRRDELLSTTLLPSVAMRNAERRGKAYHAGRLQLLVLTIRDPGVRAFVYSPSSETMLGHEYEVLLLKGVELVITDVHQVRNDYPAGLDGTVTKCLDGVVVEADVRV